MTKASFEILYNNQHGGFDLSNEVVKIMKEKDPDFHNFCDGFRGCCCSRSDLMLIQLFKEMGFERFSGDYCKVELAKIIYDTRLPFDVIKTCIDFNEYDELENVTIDEGRILIKLFEIKYFESLDQVYETIKLINDIKVEEK